MKSGSFKSTIGAVIGSAAIACLLTLGMSGTALAQSTNVPNVSTTGTHQGWTPGSSGGMHRPGVFGTVSAVSGDTLTIISKGFGANATATTYTVDATNATVTKGNTTSTVGAIQVGDTVMVQGTVSGTSVTATTIRDGVMPMGVGHRMMGGMGKTPSTSVPNITGNGEPVIGGTVSTISGTTLTITNKSNVTYSVDASSATVDKSGATSTVSVIAVGDTVVVQGTVNGTSVVASSVIDQGAAPTAGSNPMHKGGIGGFFGSIGGFFQHLFGFI